MIRFDPVQHRYWRGEVELPSVTQILKDNGVTPPYPETEDGRIQRDLGSALHRVCELYDLGKLDVDAFRRMDQERPPHLRIEHGFNEYLRFLTEHKPTWTHIEHIVYLESWSYVGTLDRAGFINGRKSVVDIKRTKSPIPATGLQVAGYAMALDPVGYRDYSLYSLVLPKEDGEYQLIEYTSPKLFRQWQSLVDCYWMRRGKIEK